VSPEYSGELRKKIEEVVARYPKKEAALLPVLHLVQNEVGFISPQEEKFVARVLGIKPLRIREVVSFHSMISPQPLGRHHIQICSNLSCHLAGSENLIDYLKSKLGIGIGETTADKKFTLSTVECLGACEQAPCMMVNFDYYGQLDKDRIDQILDGLV